MPTNTKALQVAEPVAQIAGKNAVINGGFDIWQRGTSFSLAASTTKTYIADRFFTATGASQSCTFSRQATGDTTNLPNIQYALRVQRDSGQTGTAAIYIYTGIETVNTIPLAGQNVTLSFWARKGANYSATSDLLFAYLQTGTGTDENPFNVYTGQANTISTNKTLTTTWQRFTVTATMPTNATEAKIVFGMTPTGTAGAADYFEITGVQLELGNTATPFSRAGGTIQGELAACQRYYQRFGTNSIPAICATQSATSAYCYVPTRVTMRTTPTAIDYNNLRLVNYGTAAYSVTSFTLSSSESGPDTVVFTADGASGMTANRPIFIYNTGSSGYFGFTAEL